MIRFYRAGRAWIGRLLVRALGRWGEPVRVIVFLAETRLIRRNCGSMLGFAWSLAGPVATASIMYLVFAIFIRSPIENYSIYLISGLIPWLFFVNSLNAATTSLLFRGQILHASVLPNVLHVLADVTAEAALFVLTSIVLLGLLGVGIGHMTWLAVLLPVLMLPLVICTYAGAVVVAYLSVIWRDLPYLLGIALSGLFWLQPIVYHWSTIPQPFSTIVQHNPLAILIAPAQIVMHAHSLPSISLIAGGWTLAALGVLSALTIHRMLARDTVLYL
jgi:homopolymeric O-antigen transport system permease protein